MTPAEVREVLKRMWQRNTDILSLLYAVENKNVPHSNKIHTKYEDIYKMFFVQTVPVAPNKFRAPSKLGDQVFEHPQNTLLVTIINANLDLVSLSDKAVTDPANENEVCFGHCFLYFVAISWVERSSKTLLRLYVLAQRKPPLASKHDVKVGPCKCSELGKHSQL